MTDHTCQICGELFEELYRGTVIPLHGFRCAGSLRAPMEQSNLALYIEHNNRQKSAANWNEQIMKMVYGEDFSFHYSIGKSLPINQENFPEILKNNFELLSGYGYFTYKQTFDGEKEARITKFNLWNKKFLEVDNRLRDLGWPQLSEIDPVIIETELDARLFHHREILKSITKPSFFTRIINFFKG